MTDRVAFGRLVASLAPWIDQLVFVGGWAFRLYRLHPGAQVPDYRPVVTLDADVAFAEGERLAGDIRAHLAEAGFAETLMGDLRPPVAQYALGDDAAGFYAEFLTPMSGSGRRRTGEAWSTELRAGVTAQRLRHLELLLDTPWRVRLGADWGLDHAVDVRIPNPASFIAQRLLIHDQRLPAKKAQDILYIHDTLELFGGQLNELAGLWRNEICSRLSGKQLRELARLIDAIFGQLGDEIRDAAAIPADRHLNPERMRLMCLQTLKELLQ